jgi:hypothetical protein
MARVLLLLLLLGSFASPARADLPADEAEVRRAYARCGTAPGFEIPPPLGPEDHDWSSFTVDRRTAGWLVAYTSWGNGVDAEFGGWRELFDPARCAQLRYDWGTSDGAMRSEGEIRWRNRGEPSDDELRDVASERGRSDEPAHAFAQLWLSSRCDGGPDGEPAGPTEGRSWDVVGPMAPAQPWFPGRPVTQVATFWSERSTGSPLRGVDVPGLGTPRRAHRSGAFELWTAERDDRNGAQAIALYDPRTDRHRWLAVTRGCIHGTTVRWIADGEGIAVGVTVSRHGVYAANDGVLVLDLERGLAMRLVVDGNLARSDDDDLLVAREGSRVRAATVLHGVLRLELRAIAERARLRAASPAWPPGIP